MTGRIGDYIQTRSGVMFYPMDPRAEDMHIDDIAHALSHQCRYAGHTPRFYSVAEHSVLCSRQAWPGLELTTLMHDAAEAYLQDLPRPIKRMLPEYGVMERLIEQKLRDRFRLKYPWPGVVHEIDNRMMVTEAACFFQGQSNKWWEETRYARAPYPDVIPECWPPERAKAEFLTCFNTYMDHVDV